ncbi:MAG: hypothetical protein Tsb0021_03350 [Chlamydiales bacterium]
MLAVFLDQETTGLDPRIHSVVEIAFKIYDMSSLNLMASYHSIIKQPPEVWEKRDPSSIKVNGFSLEEIQMGKDILLVRKEIIFLLTSLKIIRGKAFFICQNPAFDRSFFSQIVEVYTHEQLQWPYHWLDLASMYWVRQVDLAVQNGKAVQNEMSFSKNAIADFYHLPAEKAPHRAMNGVDHLIACYERVLNVPFNIT